MAKTLVMVRIYLVAFTATAEVWKAESKEVDTITIQVLNMAVRRQSLDVAVLSDLDQIPVATVAAVVVAGTAAEPIKEPKLCLHQMIPMIRVAVVAVRDMYIHPLLQSITQAVVG